MQLLKLLPFLLFLFPCFAHAVLMEPKVEVPPAQIYDVRLVLDTNGDPQLHQLLHGAFLQMAKKEFKHIHFLDDPELPADYTLYVLSGHRADTLVISSVLYKIQNLSTISGFLKANRQPMGNWLENQELGVVVQRSMYLSPFVEGKVYDNVHKKLTFYTRNELHNR
jgi:hypothetical protein